MTLPNRSRIIQGVRTARLRQNPNHTRTITRLLVTPEQTNTMSPKKVAVAPPSVVSVSRLLFYLAAEPGVWVKVVSIASVIGKDAAEAIELSMREAKGKVRGISTRNGVLYAIDTVMRKAILSYASGAKDEALLGPMLQYYASLETKYTSAFDVQDIRSLPPKKRVRAFSSNSVATTESSSPQKKKRVVLRLPDGVVAATC